MPLSHLLSYFQSHLSSILVYIRSLVEQETPSDDKARLDLFASALLGRLKAAGAAGTLISGSGRGNHVRAQFDSGEGSARPALVLCHYDTVWPVGALESHPFRVDDAGLAFGPGIFDMKSSLILVEYALRALVELELALPRPVVVLATSDEEVGSPTSRSLIEEEARSAAYVLVLESPLPNGVLKTARKGTRNFQIRVTGRAAHAGVEPEKGASAIQELAHQILHLHSLTDLAAGTTVNVGVVRGGSRRNVVAATAEAEVDVRAWTLQELERVSQAILTLQSVTPHTVLHVDPGAGRPPLERSVTRDLFRQAEAIGAELGLELQEGSTGGGSDGNLTAALGVPTLDGLGVPGHGAHADHEHIQIREIPGRAALLTALLLRLQ